MPSLTVNTSPTTKAHQDGHSPMSNAKSRSVSPVRPAIEPITPTLHAARPVHSRHTYTHSQPPQVAIPPPPLEPIHFDDNPDVLATKAAISILMMQARRATEDIHTLQRSKERALQDPDGFYKALETGQIKHKNDTFMGIPTDDDEDDEDEDEEATRATHPEMSAHDKAWEKLPTAQDVVRMPHINWDQYAVVGESLGKLHADQLRHPPEGFPQRIGPDGQLLMGGFGSTSITPARDKNEKMGTRKGGKR